MITLEQLTEVVKQASTLMRTDHFDIREKDGAINIVTSSDVAVQDYLCTHLAELMPESGFYCEEKDLWDSTHEWTWIIDPIDGTANYSRGIAECAICVGLKHHDDMQMSVVYLPMTQELFTAERGKGSYRNGKRLHVSDRKWENSIMCAALSLYHKQWARACQDIIYETYMQINDVRRFGAAAPEICYLGMGRIELFFEYMLSPWDFAAASLILTEAGGVISDLKGHKLTFQEPSGILAANSQESLDKLVKIVGKFC